ncbi:hypothetical protein [Paenibacillus sp. IHBB 3054]|uniref:hypothetical protein n=1 Tax=Paenibacillus sp. IHBB 3054 TaxID=3425689 RepID=UPI003F665611
MEIYKGYTIIVTKSQKRFKASSNSGDDYVDDTEVGAIAGLKQKIDNIVLFHEMQEVARRKREE